jgi:hypothetical protein
MIDARLFHYSTLFGVSVVWIYWWVYLTMRGYQLLLFLGSQALTITQTTCFVPNTQWTRSSIYPIPRTPGYPSPSFFLLLRRISAFLLSQLNENNSAHKTEAGKQDDEPHVYPR